MSDPPEGLVYASGIRVWSRSKQIVGFKMICLFLYLLIIRIIAIFSLLYKGDKYYSISVRLPYSAIDKAKRQ